MSLVGFLTSWVRDIVIIFVLISIMELIIPNGNMRKYIDIIIGFLIIIMIINPFVKLLNRSLSINYNLFDSSLDQSEYGYNENLSKVQQEQMQSIYTEKFQAEINELIYTRTGYEVEEVKLSLDDKDDFYGSIKSMELYLRKRKTSGEAQKGAIVVDNINKISVGEEREMDSSSMESENENIRDIIASKYDIPEENIKIFLNTSEGMS